MVVDDEPDVGRFVGLELTDCEVEVATSAAEARQRFASTRYDLAILDIMGVEGFELLQEFRQRAPCIMLTAHALNEEALKRSIEEKAVLYLPKEEIGRIEEYVAKALGAKESLWPWLLDRVDFTRWFGPISDFGAPGARPAGASRG
jgi:CheY-like chemotaxis protein